MNRPTPRLVRGLAIAVLSSALLATTVGTAVPATADEVRGEEPRRKPTLIQVKVGDRGPYVRQNLLGINHRYIRNAMGLWDELLDQPDPRVIDDMVAAGVSSLRFPGGTTATMYKWKRAIAKSPADRDCQIEGHGHHKTEGFKAHRSGLAYGPDEFMEVVDQTGAAPLIMMPFVSQTPADAADFVEYMNTPVGRNPHGGVAWAKVRADNGHRAPYGVRRWEVGNESHVGPGRFDFSTDGAKAVRQYINGGTRTLVRQPLGKACSHSRGADEHLSTGRGNQVFDILFTPATVQKVYVGGVPWKQVEDVSTRGPEATVYEVRNGRWIVFGDGRVHPGSGNWIGNGLIPPEDLRVRATYKNKYSGFFAFAREMHEVDRSIDVCASWGTTLFSRVTRGRKFDCQSAHPLTNFSREYGHNWRPWKGPLEGHDRMMLGLADRYGDVEEMLRATPKKSPVWLTEFQPIHGNGQDFPSWSSSVSNAVYMASQWAAFLKLGIPWGNGGDLLGRGPGAVLGGPNELTFSVEAYLRMALRPMFYEAERVVGTATVRNPTRAPKLRPKGSYKALSVAAARAPGGKVWVLVVNRLPSTKVRAKVQLAGVKLRKKAVVRRVAGPSFRAWNPPNAPPRVTMNTWHRSVGNVGFKAKLPAHSVTVYRVQTR